MSMCLSEISSIFNQTCTTLGYRNSVTAVSPTTRAETFLMLLEISVTPGLLICRQHITGLCSVLCVSFYPSSLRTYLKGHHNTSPQRLMGFSSHSVESYWIITKRNVPRSHLIAFPKCYKCLMTCSEP